eukprot:TRINITY_DN0_c3904_g1_i1.p1 TRINITY_DN0_c3904_g1~~TRINITY_DN0_c3904_g1_i1.p1  ORF type:complete len:115 (-),score=36.63 TRINITY_DN0_c3904_g1_i1:53-397(-)
MRSVVVAVLVLSFVAFVCANSENGNNQGQGTVRSLLKRVRCTGLRRRVNNNPAIKKSENTVDKSIIPFGPVSGGLFIAKGIAKDAKESFDRRQRVRRDKEDYLKRQAEEKKQKK